jgi:hypothetical protein
MITVLLNNKNTIAIGVGVFLILLLLYFSSTPSTPSTPSKLSVQKPITVVQKYNKCELFPRCNFNKNGIVGEERNQLIQKYPDLNISDKTMITDITIINSTNIKFDDVCIQSIKSEGYVITLYSKTNFTGEKMTLTDKINIECFEKPIRSARIDIMDDIQLNDLKLKKI